jgi:hypothetical protein
MGLTVKFVRCECFDFEISNPGPMYFCSIMKADDQSNCRKMDEV